MAKVLNRILDFIGLEADDEQYEEEQMAPQPDYSYGRQQASSQQPTQINFEEYAGSQQQQAKSSRRASVNKDNKVINVYKNNGSSNLIIFRPVSCEDSSHMIDSLKNNRPVIANFENIDREKAQRILDMMSGAMYAISGTVHQVSKSIYVFAPENIDVSGEGKDSAPHSTISNLYMDFTK